MRVFERVIQYRNRRDEFTLWPLSDIHLGNAACDEERLDVTLREIAADPRALYLLLGDQLDSINKHDKRFDISALPRWLLESYYAGESLGRAQADELTRRLLSHKKLAGKCLGVIEGNHEQSILARFGVDTYRPVEERLRETPDQRLDFGTSGILRLKFQQVTENSERPGHTYQMDIYCHHGWGGGDLAGGVALKIEREMGRFEADLVLMGHVHKVQTIPRARPIRVNAALKLEQPPDIVGAYCGTFLRGRLQDRTVYGERSGYGPSATSRVRVAIRPYLRTFAVSTEPVDTVALSCWNRLCP